MEEQTNLLATIKTWVKWKKFIIIIVVISMIASVVGSLMMPNYYKSQSVFYPLNLSTFDRVILFSTESSDKVLNYAGSKEDINRVLAMAQSSSLIDHLIGKFDLVNYYGIDSTSPMWFYKTKKQFLENYKAIKTELNNVVITVWDTDPEMAATICNYAVEVIDNSYIDPFLERNRQTLGTISKNLKKKEEQLAKLNQEISVIKDTNSLKYKMLSSVQKNAIKDFSSLTTLEEQYDATANNKLPSIHILETARAAEKKSRPTRWVIVAGASLGALFFSLIFALLIEKFREIKTELGDAK